MSRFGPCLCGDTECPSCGPLQGGPTLPEEWDYIEDEPGDGMTDAEADADTLKSAGYGTDEDYGYFGNDD